MTEKKSSRLVPAIMLSFGALVCLWVAATMVGALHQANWQVSELARQYMLATGMMRPMHTLVRPPDLDTFTWRRVQAITF